MRKIVRIMATVLAALTVVGYMTFSLNSSRVRAASGDVSRTVSNTMKASVVILTANSKVGSQYVWGASGPNTFDCGGLVRYCAGKAGTSLKTDTAANNFRELLKINQAQYFYRSNLSDGCFIYYRKIQDGKVVDNGRYECIYHAAIYIGSGMIVDASSSKEKVVKRPRSTFKSSSEVGYGYAYKI